MSHVGANFLYCPRQGMTRTFSCWRKRWSETDTKHILSILSRAAKEEIALLPAITSRYRDFVSNSVTRKVRLLWSIAYSLRGINYYCSCGKTECWGPRTECLEGSIRQNAEVGGGSIPDQRQVAKYPKLGLTTGDEGKTDGEKVP